MITLYGNTELEYCALEELHNSMGIITENAVCFMVASNETRHYCGEGCPSVYFPCLRMEVSIPSKIETYIERNNLYIESDILGCIIQALSCHEEKSKPKDRYGRMPLTEAAAYRQGVYQTAYLDCLIAQFRTHFTAYLDSQNISWEQISPSKKPLICLTHDVDSIRGKSVIRYAFWLISAALTLRRSKIKEALNRIRLFVNLVSDPHFSFRTFCEIEKSCGFRSTFFIMSLPFFLGREGRRYSLHRSGLKEALTQLSKDGWEIGLHPSRATHLSMGRLRKETFRFVNFMKYELKSIGMRNHYLRASFPETWRIQEELGIRYDSSLGWPDAPGFRAGTARPFRPFDCGLSRRLCIWELPLVVMDGTLNGSIDNMVETCKHMAEEAFRYDAPFTLLWHTDRISQFEYPDFHYAYVRILDFLKENECIGLTASDIVRTYQRYSDEMAKNRRRI